MMVLIKMCEVCEQLEDQGFDMMALEDQGITLKRKTVYVNGKKVSAQDLIYYYAHDARNITSGCRQLGSMVGDWRPIDNIAKQVLEIYKVLKRDILVRECKKYGMSPKGW
jgi:hypothetical protein